MLIPSSARSPVTSRASMSWYLRPSHPLLKRSVEFSERSASAFRASEAVVAPPARCEGVDAPSVLMGLGDVLPEEPSKSVLQGSARVPHLPGDDFRADAKVLHHTPQNQLVVGV